MCEKIIILYWIFWGTLKFYYLRKHIIRKIVSNDKLIIQYKVLLILVLNYTCLQLRADRMWMVDGGWVGPGLWWLSNFLMTVCGISTCPWDVVGLVKTLKKFEICRMFEFWWSTMLVGPHKPSSKGISWISWAANLIKINKLSVNSDNSIQ